MICWNTEILRERVEALFIGGPADGTRRTLLRREPEWKFAVNRPQPVRSPVAEYVAPTDRFETANYRSFDLWTGDGGRFTVYAWDQLSERQVMELLLHNYNPKGDLVTV